MSAAMVVGSAGRSAAGNMSLPSVPAATGSMIDEADDRSSVAAIRIMVESGGG